MTALRPTSTILIDDVATPVLAWSTDHRLDQIGQASLTLARPLPPQVVDNATVEIRAAADVGQEQRIVFGGALRANEDVFEEGGAAVTLRAEGWLHLLEFPTTRDLVWAGGAGTEPAAAGTPPRHIGAATIPWYAEPAPWGLSHDIAWEPAVESSFVIIRGYQHGANSYATGYEGEITNWSRCEIWQNGRRLGYANLPVSDERYDEELDYSDVFNWDAEPFELTIAARVRVADGEVTRRFVAGRKPGTSLRDDFEVRGVTRATAAQMTARQIIRGLFWARGFGGASGLNVVVDELVSLSGVVIELGGNGWVDNGQIRIEAGESFLRFIQRVANLFGYHVYDSPDAVCRVRAVRGLPSPTAPVDATFTEGGNALRVRRSRDLKPTVNYWRVLGASGTDADGATFQYRSEPEPSAIPDNPNIPEPPGWVAQELSDSLLVSDTLCLYVRHIAEVNSQDGQTEVEWETWGTGTLQPGRVVELTAPSVDFAGRLFLTGIRREWSEAGYWQTLTGWRGSGRPLPEVEDPDPLEAASPPVLAPPADRWRPYEPRRVS